jgi:plastocyanin
MVTVSMDHNTFIPGEITVVPGTTVTWVNNESMPHTVVDLNKSFRSKTLAKDASFSFTFTAAGDYAIWLITQHEGQDHRRAQPACPVG